MATVQIPTKLRRNAPCYCGSGHKYKKCCEKKEGETKMNEVRQDAICPCKSGLKWGDCCGREKPKLKNEFREEVRDPYAGIPEDELVTRDQAVLLRELRFRVDGFNSDRDHLNEAVEKAKALRMELLAMPKSPGREGALKGLEGQIENLKKQVETLKPPRQMLITLLALEEIFGKTDTGAIAEPTTPTSVEIDEDEEALTIDQDDDPKEVI